MTATKEQPNQRANQPQPDEVMSFSSFTSFFFFFLQLMHIKNST